MRVLLQEIQLYSLKIKQNNIHWSSRNIKKKFWKVSHAPLSIVENTRGVLKFFHCAFNVTFLFLANQATVMISWGRNTRESGFAYFLEDKFSHLNVAALFKRLAEIVCHARSPVWITWRVSLSTSLLFQIRLENLHVKSCRRTGTITLRASFQARIFITSALW